MEAESKKDRQGSEKGEDMRMWMCDPAMMCNKHLLGEHVELHMFLGHFRARRGIKGYIEHNCVEPMSVVARHNAIAEEMKKRGMKHDSRLEMKATDIKYLSPVERAVKVAEWKNRKELIRRCRTCAARANSIGMLIRRAKEGDVK